MRVPSRPTEARTSHFGRNLAKTVSQTALMWGVFLYALPLAVVRIEHAATDWVLPPTPPGIPCAIFALLGASGIYCGVLFAWYGKGTPLPLDTATRFIVLGPYRWVRNPMALFGIGQGVCIALILRSPAVLAYALAGGLMWHCIARPWEERDLVLRFGAPYRAYQGAVRNWIPRLRPYAKIFGQDRLPNSTDEA